MILVVDDNPHVSEMLGAFLKMNGYAVKTARSGQLALQIICANERSVNLLVADINIPGMSGIDLATEITRINPLTRIVLITGYADEADLATLRWPLIVKPFPLRTLLDLVRKEIGSDKAPLCF